MGFTFEIGPHAPCESLAAPAALPLTIPARDPAPADRVTAAEHESRPAHFARRVTLTTITRR